VGVDWELLADELALLRETYGADPHRFPIWLGVDDPEGLIDYISRDAVDSIRIGYRAVRAQMESEKFFNAEESACATVVANTALLYLELGLWLAQTGRVKP
jgi:hypothetical protein